MLAPTAAAPAPLDSYRNSPVQELPMQMDDIPAPQVPPRKLGRRTRAKLRASQALFNLALKLGPTATATDTSAVLSNANASQPDRHLCLEHPG